MFPTQFPSQSQQSQQSQQSRNPSPSPTRIQTPPESQPLVVYKPSAKLKRLKNVNKWHFLLVNFSIGVTITNFFRLSPDHILLGVVGVIAGTVALFVISPADRTYCGLWHSGGVGLALGGILCFWDLYKLLTWQHCVGMAVVFIFVLWVIGAGK